MRKTRGDGFTLIELLVVIGIIALLIAILLPALNKARDAGYRAACGSNLHQIGLAMMIYAQDNHGSFPRTYWYQDLVYNAGTPTATNSGDHTWMGIRAFTDPASVDPFVQPTNPTDDDVAMPWDSTKRPGDNDVTAALFLLVRIQHLNPAVFVCPGRAFYPDNLNNQPASMRSNFSSPWNLAYSVSLPYPLDDNWAWTYNYKWGTQCKPGFALMADLNPGESFNGPYGQNCVVTVSGLYSGVGPTTPTDPMSLQKRANSNNHKKAGQNVLYGDGHVQWCQTAFCGYQNDNIYTMVYPGSTAQTGRNNIYTSDTQLVINPGAGLGSGTDSCMQPSDGALTIGYGVGIQ